MLSPIRTIMLLGFVSAVALTLGAPPARSAEAEAQPADPVVRVKIQLIQIDSPQAEVASPPRPATENAWEPADINDPVVVLVDPTTHPAGLGAMLVDHNHTIELAGAPCRYQDGELRPASRSDPSEAPTPPFSGKTIAAPTIKLTPNKKGELNIGQQVPRLIQRKDGSVESDAQARVEIGIQIGVLVDHANEDGISFADLRIQRTYFQQRTPVVPVAFDSALTVTTSLETSLSFALPRDKFALLKVPAAPKDAAVFAVLSATLDQQHNQAPRQFTAASAPAARLSLGAPARRAGVARAMGCFLADCTCPTPRIPYVPRR